jgi:hypothetical protein
MGKDADARGLAIDTFIAGVENGTVDISTLTETLVKLSDRERHKEFFRNAKAANVVRELQKDFDRCFSDKSNSKY